MKINSLCELLKKYNKKVWVMYNNEGKDKIFNKYIYPKFETSTICFVSQKDIYIVVSSLDKNNITEELSNEYKIYTYTSNLELSNIIEEIIEKLHFPNNICLSYSTISDLNTDILTHGSYIEITKLLKKSYSKYSKKISFSSAENVIYELESKKTELQIERLKYLADVTSNILEETFNNIKIGMSEKDIVTLTRKIADKYMMNIINSKKENIIGYDMAWIDCPIVLVGENLAKGGHSLPSDKTLQKGNTIYFDFGIKAIYEDGDMLYTDIQRMGYSLKDNEKDVPKQIMKVFNTLVSSIEEGIDNLKPGVKGYDIDKIVRGKIIKAGYPEYNHATGHPVGCEVHDIGTIISKKGSKRANLPLVENAIYTLEPRINIANGGSIEEMIQVTKYGGIPLCKTQNKLYIVK